MKKLTSTLTLLSCLVSIVLPMAASADLSKDEKEFIKNTAQDGMTEVKLGQIASRRAKAPDVKNFAKDMIADHSKANDKLKSIAKDKGVELTDKLNPAHQTIVDKFEKMEQTSFDSSYKDQMIADHTKVVSNLSSNNNLPDADLRKWVNDTLPTVKHHLQMSKTLKPGTM